MDLEEELDLEILVGLQIVRQVIYTSLVTINMELKEKVFIQIQM